MCPLFPLPVTLVILICAASKEYTRERDLTAEAEMRGWKGTA